MIKQCVDMFYIGFIDFILNNKRPADFTNIFLHNS